MSDRVTDAEIEQVDFDIDLVIDQLDFDAEMCAPLYTAKSALAQLRADKADLEAQLAAAREERDLAVASNAALLEKAEKLYGWLDDIDTADDAAKGNDAEYRRLVRNLHKKRHEIATTDGYTVSFGDHPGAALLARYKALEADARLLHVLRESDEWAGATFGVSDWAKTSKHLWLRLGIANRDVLYELVTQKAADLEAQLDAAREERDAATRAYSRVVAECEEHTLQATRHVEEAVASNAALLERGIEIHWPCPCEAKGHLTCEGCYFCDAANDELQPDSVLPGAALLARYKALEEEVRHLKEDFLRFNEDGEPERPDMWTLVEAGRLDELEQADAENLALWKVAEAAKKLADHSECFGGECGGCVYEQNVRAALRAAQEGGR